MNSAVFKLPQLLTNLKYIKRKKLTPISAIIPNYCPLLVLTHAHDTSYFNFMLPGQ